MTLRWPLTPYMLSHVRLYPRIIVSNSHGNTSKYVDTVVIFKKLDQKDTDPKMTFDPTSVEVACVSLPKDHCIQVPCKYVKVYRYSDLFSYNLNQRSLTPRWPLTSMAFNLKSVEVTFVTLPKDHCVQVLWKYIKVCGYSDPSFPKNESWVINL